MVEIVKRKCYVGRHLNQATHRGQGGNQMSAHPYCVPLIILRIYHKSQEFFS